MICMKKNHEKKDIGKVFFICLKGKQFIKQYYKSLCDSYIVDLH